MSAKLFSRSGAFVWAPRGVQVKGLLIGDFAQYYDPNAPNVVQNLEFYDKEHLLAEPNPTPNASASTNYRFNELSWYSKCSDAHPLGVIGGGTENGTVVIFDAQKFVKENRLEVLSARRDHQGHVLTIDTSCDAKYLASGGSNGQILLWDPENLQQPYSPGPPNSPDHVKSIRWNRSITSVFGSITSRKVTLWDLRNGEGPKLEMAEVPSCDWSSLTWHPTDANYLIVGSQSAHCPLIHKYDIRFGMSPVAEYRHHQDAVTSIDWHKADSRLLMSSGSGGQVLIWSHETSEVLGGVGNLQNDWIRSVKWNEEEPDEFAIQYYRSPVQIGSLTTLGSPQPGAEVLAPRVAEHFVPAWRRAPIVGSSMSLGGQVATFWKSYDPSTQTWKHNVEIEPIVTEDNVGAAEMDKYLSVKDNKRELGWYLHDRAHVTTLSSESPEDVEVERMLWSSLLGVMEDKGRSKMLAHLGIVHDNEEVFEQEPTTTSTTSAQNTTDTSRSAISSTSSIGTEVSSSTTGTVYHEPSIVEKCVGVDWKQLGDSGWTLLHCALRKDYLAAIRILLDSNQHVAAMMYAAKNAPEHMTMVLNHFNSVSSSTHPLSTLISALSDTPTEVPQQYRPSSVPGDYTHHIDDILKTFPDEKWRELLGLIIAQEVTPEELRAGAKHLGVRWFEMGKPLRACICFIVAGEVDHLLTANSMFPTTVRLIQALVLHGILKRSVLPPQLDKLLVTYSDTLITNGSTLTAWNLLKGIRNGSAELEVKQWTAWKVAGGEECTGDAAPFALYDIRAAKSAKRMSFENPNYSRSGNPPRTNVMQQNGPPTYNSYSPPQAPPPMNNIINQAPPPPMNPNIAPMPPSSTYYQQQPPMPSNMPPPKPAAPVTAGWNDPPPGMLIARQTPPTVAKPNVMEITWKPVETAPAPGGMMAPIQRNAPNAIYQQMQGMSISNPPSTPGSSVLPSPALSSHAPQAPPPIQLSPEDEQLMAPIFKFLDAAQENARNQAKFEKANDLRGRIQMNLVPRLAQNRLTGLTKHYLANMSYYLASNQLNEAKSAVNQMAQNKEDFVEVSTFLPALKSLFSLAR